MSSLQQHESETEQAAFEELIQKDSDICNNCFRRTHDTFERNYFVTTFKGELWLKEVDDRPPRSWARPDELTYIPGIEASEGTHLVCKCGIQGDNIRPVSLGKAMQYTRRIAERLDEKEVRIDRDELFDKAREQLRRPDMQGKQDEAFAKAVKRALPKGWSNQDS